ncbi:MAG: FAD binding domain-containing protein [Cyanobacteria bacterium NC_groundwater_1444_Ag_S-0.65um_54_12]|nr:FAD binding domain-containing protein [Cyanobacteria bacterium NC_groundwater_1444_Ag_S-0.65um_54_12]
MLRLPPFNYLRPDSLGEAISLLAEYGDTASLVAGGTDLYPNMKRRQVEPQVLIGLSGIAELSGITGDAATGLTIGSATKLQAVAPQPALKAAAPALAMAASLVATPQLRHMGTIGGNLCLATRCRYYNQSHDWRRAIGFCLKGAGNTCQVAPGSARCWAVCSSDTAPALWSLGAKVRLVGPDGARQIPLAELYQDDGISHLAKAPTEILTAICLPPAAGWRSTYLKLRRRDSFDFPVLGVAVALKLEDNIVKAGKIVLGAVGSCPREAREAADLLLNRPLADELIAKVAMTAVKIAKPLDNTDLTSSYRRKMVRQFVARALGQLGSAASDN